MADEDRIARVARALCVADGRDPEDVVNLGVDEIEVDGTTYSRDVLVPAWTSYDGEARRLVAAGRVEGVLESPE